MWCTSNRRPLRAPCVFHFAYLPGSFDFSPAASDPFRVPICARRTATCSIDDELPGRNQPAGCRLARAVALSSSGILVSRIDSIFSGFEFSDHDWCKVPAKLELRDQGSDRLQLNSSAAHISVHKPVFFV